MTQTPANNPQNKPDNSKPQNRFKTILKSKAFWLPMLAVLILSLSIGGYFWYQSRLVQTKLDPQSTKIMARVDGLGEGAPLTLINSDNNSTILPNGQETEISSGDYRLVAGVDGLGKIDSQLKVLEGQDNNFDLKLTNDEISSNPALASAPKLGNSTSNVSLIKTADLKVDGQNITPTSLILPSGEGSKTLVQDTQAILSPTNGDASKQTYQNNLIVTVPNSTELKTVIKDCTIFKINADSKGQHLRYFKVCSDTGQNGFYDYDVAAGQEKLLLTSSDEVNMVRTDIDPNSQNIVFTKQSGEFGLVRDGKVEILIQNSYYSAPKFSPDGKYLLVMDNYASRPENQGKTKTDGNLYDSFGLKIRVVETADLYQNGDKANFKEIGTTYYIPRPDDYTFEFWKWLDNGTFQVGDSPRVFSITNGATQYQDDDGKLPGRIYTTKSGLKFRLHQGILSDDKNKILATQISGVIEKNGEYYFVISNYLMRIQDGALIQAYPIRLLNYYTKDNSLYLINQNGELIQY